ncbi:MAG TPA: hypothetical protein VH021_23195, partial [Trebonia sp.]|nr:hypothetical protein [Trebonia sp.]
MDCVGAGGVDVVRRALARGAPDCLGAGDAGRGGDCAGAAGIGPVVRTGGCAGPRAPAAAPPPLAQPAEPPFEVGVAPLVGSGSGGAVRPVPTPAAGHCRPAEWLSAVGTPDIPSAEVARTPSPVPATVPSSPPPSDAVRRAQRDARDTPAPGTTVPAVVAVIRR